VIINRHYVFDSQSYPHFINVVQDREVLAVETTL